MNRFSSFLPLTLGIGLALLSGCDQSGEELAITEQPIPEGYALSAGTSTAFLTSTFAYDTEADWVRGKLGQRFRDGDGLYDDAMNAGNGLGPVYAGYACGSCHRNAGRTTPSVWTKLTTKTMWLIRALQCLTRCSDLRARPSIAWATTSPSMRREVVHRCSSRRGSMCE